MKQETIQKLYMYGVMILVVLIMAIAVLLFAKEEPIEKPVGADLIKPVECPVCPSCTITAERIISNNPTIQLPDSLVSFKYDGKIYTKAVLDEAKLTLDAIK